MDPGVAPLAAGERPAQHCDAGGGCRAAAKPQRPQSWPGIISAAAGAPAWCARTPTGLGRSTSSSRNAAKAGIPFYGSYTETDPAVIASEGVDRFKRDGFEVIIVDTSGRHRQEDALFEEMLQVSNAIAPDSVIFVMDATIGQACEAQALAFKRTVDVGSVIVTKLDSRAKGGGALSAIAATRSPVVFVGTGEHIEDFEQFKVKQFVQKLLGMGDLAGLIDKVSEMSSSQDEASNAEKMRRLRQGLFTLRDFQEQFATFQRAGSFSQVMAAIPGFWLAWQQERIGRPGPVQARYLTVLDSMSDSELDAADGCRLFSNCSARATRVARGSGVSEREVKSFVLCSVSVLTVMVRRVGGIRGLFSADGDLKSDASAASMARPAGSGGALVRFARLATVGGASGLQSLLRQDYQKIIFGGAARLLFSHAVPPHNATSERRIDRHDTTDAEAMRAEMIQIGAGDSFARLLAAAESAKNTSGGGGASSTSPPASPFSLANVCWLLAALALLGYTDLVRARAVRLREAPSRLADRRRRPHRPA
uniref:Signal recognition particle subunit SRP54 n=1 Tax=Macrostomum lignano TaxID=282301 RepID=A0A1I8FBV8_9PLAT